MSWTGNYDSGNIITIHVDGIIIDASNNNYYYRGYNYDISNFIDNRHDPKITHEEHERRYKHG